MSTAQKLAAALGDHVRVWKMGPGGIVIEIDSNDPDTPALVWDSIRRTRSSTYDCACSEGSIDDIIDLGHEQLRWLEGFGAQVQKAFEIARRDLPQYQ